MKTQRNILIAFILNLSFSIFEFFGGIFTGSVVILSDAVHDLGDAASIGLSYFLEKKSKNQPDEVYTYGYSGYSVIGSIITTLILIFGSCAVLVNAVGRIIQPAEIKYDEMILFAVVGVVVNLAAAFFTRKGDSLNQKAVNLHMIEDVLGWVVVLIGAVVMRFTDWYFLDPLLSVAVSLVILFNAAAQIKVVLILIMNKVPCGISVLEIKEHLLAYEGISDVHHIHIWSLDGNNHIATLHVVAERNHHEIKRCIREKLHEFGISHVTVEIESAEEKCYDLHCHLKPVQDHCHHHHH